MTDKPQNVSRDDFSARLQVLPLVGESFVLIFDQQEGPPLPTEQAKRIKDETGAKAVLSFRGIIDIGC